MCVAAVFVIIVMMSATSLRCSKEDSVEIKTQKILKNKKDYEKKQRIIKM